MHGMLLWMLVSVAHSNLRLHAGTVPTCSEPFKQLHLKQDPFQFIHRARHFKLRAVFPPHVQVSGSDACTRDIERFASHYVAKACLAHWRESYPDQLKSFLTAHVEDVAKGPPWSDCSSAALGNELLEVMNDASADALELS